MAECSVDYNINSGSMVVFRLKKMQSPGLLDKIVDQNNETSQFTAACDIVMLLIGRAYPFDSSSGFSLARMDVLWLAVRAWLRPEE